MEIKTDGEYQAALNRLWKIWPEDGTMLASKAAKEFDALVDRIKAYEDRMDWFNQERD